VAKEVPLEATTNHYVTDPEALRVEESKITEYLLNEDHDKGHGKAKYFLGRGFSLSKWELLKVALIQHAKNNKIANTREHAFGKNIVVDCNLETPSGNNHCIRVVWNDHGDGTPPRLITAHPLT
jgi:hypothetical protein